MGNRDNGDTNEDDTALSRPGVLLALPVIFVVRLDRDLVTRYCYAKVTIIVVEAGLTFECD